MRTTRSWTTAIFGLAMLTSASACVEEGDARDDSLIEPYTDHDEPLDFEPVEGKTDGVSEVFNANLVVDDSFFTASNALTPAQIQAFFEHTPYNNRSFLADEKVNGKPFSQVLVEVAQSRQINPIMLLSRMQVEKSLVGKTTRPSGNTVDFAFGCGCPDNQPCNEAYRGIDKQLDCAAKTLKTHYDGSISGTSAWRKGKTKNTLDPQSVTPQSHATASLYSYTPWVLTGSGGNWLVWNIIKKYSKALEISVPSGPQPGFVGSPCTEETVPEEQAASFATCEFSASGETGFCYPFTTPAGESLGVCSLMCAGYCPDQGTATTFCTELETGAPRPIRAAEHEVERRRHRPQRRPQRQQGEHAELELRERQHHDDRTADRRRCPRQPKVQQQPSQKPPETPGSSPPRSAACPPRSTAGAERHPPPTEPRSPVRT